MKKSIIIFSLFLILLSSIVIPVKKVDAAAPVLRLIGGQQATKIMIGIAEKSGVKFANKKARDKAIDRWNWEWKKLDEVNDSEIKARYDLYKQQLDNAIVTPIPDKPGFGKVLVSSAMFLTGLDMVVEAYHAFNNAYEEQQYINTLSTNISKGNYYSSLGSYSIREVPRGNGSSYVSLMDFSIWNGDLDYASRDKINYGWGMPTGAPYHAYVEISSVSDMWINAIIHFKGLFAGDNSERTNETYRDLYIPDLFKDDTRISEPTFIPEINDVPDIDTIVPQSVPVAEPGIETEIIPENLPDEVEIIIPIEVDYPLPEDGPIQEPLPEGDSGIDPGGDSGEVPSLWDWLKNLLDKILEWLKKIWEAITGLVNSILNGIVSLFIPSADFWSNSVSELNELMKIKLPLIAQLSSFFGTIKDTTFSSRIPEFLIDIPKDWGGGTYPIIDFSYFTQYRTWVLNFIRFSAWFVFLKRLYNRIPKIIY